MNQYEYSYTILKYRHDAVAGEVLNVGVVVFCRETGQVGILFDHRYRRLSQTFAHFDAEMYKRVLERLAASLERLGKPMSGNLFELEQRDHYIDVAALVRAAWPDQGLSYFAGPVSGGITADLNQEMSELYDRFVLSQFDARDAGARFDDQQLWDAFKRVLTHRGIVDRLQRVVLGSAEVEFDHAYKNERWHVIEPVSLDYLDGSGMKKRAFEIAGKAAAVRDVIEMGTFYVLLGKPRRVDAEKQYASARRILADAIGSIKVIEESEKESFAADLEEKMRAHGLVK